MKPFRNYLFRFIGIAIIGFMGCRQEQSFTPVEQNASLKFNPFGIGYAQMSVNGFGFINVGVVDVRQMDNNQFFLIGVSGQKEAAIARQSEDKSVSRPLRLLDYKWHNNRKIFGDDFSPEIAGYMQITYNLISNSRNEISVIPSFSDSGIVIFRYSPDLILKDTLFIKLQEKIGPTTRLYFVEGTHVCSDDADGYFIFSYPYYNAPNMSFEPRPLFLHVDANGKILKSSQFTTFERILGVSKMIYRNGHITFITRDGIEYGSVYNNDINAAFEVNPATRWTYSYNNKQPAAFANFGDSLFIAEVVNSTDVNSGFFKSFKVSLIDLNTGNKIWENHFSFSEPEDRFSVAINCNSRHLVVGYGANMEGQMLQLNHSGKLIHSNLLKGDNTRTQVTQIGLTNNSAWVYGLSAKSDGTQLRCFEKQYSLK